MEEGLYVLLGKDGELYIAYGMLGELSNNGVPIFCCDWKGKILAQYAKVDKIADETKYQVTFNGSKDTDLAFCGKRYNGYAIIYR